MPPSPAAPLPFASQIICLPASSLSPHLTSLAHTLGCRSILPTLTKSVTHFILPPTSSVTIKKGSRLDQALRNGIAVMRGRWVERCWEEWEKGGEGYGRIEREERMRPFWGVKVGLLGWDKDDPSTLSLLSLLTTNGASSPTLTPTPSTKFIIVSPSSPLPPPPSEVSFYLKQEWVAQVILDKGVRFDRLEEFRFEGNGKERDLSTTTPIFGDMRFLIDLPLDQATVVESAIKLNGGVISLEEERVDWIVVDVFTSPPTPDVRKTGIAWIERCLFEERFLTPSSHHLLEKPLGLGKLPIDGANSLQLVLTKFSPIETVHLTRLIKAIGATLHPTLTRSRTHLLLGPKGGGKMVTKAVEWGIPVVGREWLLDWIRERNGGKRERELTTGLEGSGSGAGERERERERPLRPSLDGSFLDDKVIRAEDLRVEGEDEREEEGDLGGEEMMDFGPRVDLVEDEVIEGEVEEEALREERGYQVGDLTGFDDEVEMFDEAQQQPAHISQPLKLSKHLLSVVPDSEDAQPSSPPSRELQTPPKIIEPDSSPPEPSTAPSSPEGDQLQFQQPPAHQPSPTSPSPPPQASSSSLPRLRPSSSSKAYSSDPIAELQPLVHAPLSLLKKRTSEMLAELLIMPKVENGIGGVGAGKRRTRVGLGRKWVKSETEVPQIPRLGSEGPKRIPGQAQFQTQQTQEDGEDSDEVEIMYQDPLARKRQNQILAILNGEVPESEVENVNGGRKRGRKEVEVMEKEELVVVMVERKKESGAKKRVRGKR